VNIHVRISAILERLVEMLAFVLKDAGSIGKLRNDYHALIVGSQLLQLVDDAHYISEAIMLPNTIIDFDQRYKKDFDQKYKKDFDQKYEKELMRK
jgi:hypothetical protein